MEWLYSLKKEVLGLLAAMKEEGGYYRYSLSGDIYGKDDRWGLGNTVFAAKTYYMLESLQMDDREKMAAFIKSFQDDEGYIYDRKVKALSRMRRYSAALRQRDLNNIFNEQTKNAETRQSFAALRCLGSRPDKAFTRIPYSREAITEYIMRLNWQLPWGAASHVSHLVFFLHSNALLFGLHGDDAESLIDHVFKTTDKYRHEDGSWYLPGSGITLQLKINAAMKMMTAYGAAERDDFTHARELIDLCLSAVNNVDACDNFNIVCVLYNASRKTDHRIDEIKEFCTRRLEIYRSYYWPEHGGFSFLQRNANSIYYGARITKGLREPDIHGTALFLWGITLITDILGIRDELGLKIPYT